MWRTRTPAGAHIPSVITTIMDHKLQGTESGDRIFARFIKKGPYRGRHFLKFSFSSNQQVFRLKTVSADLLNISVPFWFVNRLENSEIGLYKSGIWRGQTFRQRSNFFVVDLAEHSSNQLATL
jgi:hypothetical protein